MLKPPSAGSFQCPLLDESGATCLGVQTVDGTKYYADKVVLAAGAWSPALVDLEDQCVSKASLTEARKRKQLLTNVQAWVYAHMQLSKDEAKEYQDSPVVYNSDIGFFFEPNE